MKHLYLSTIAAGFLLASSLPTLAAEHAGYVDFGKLSPSTSGREFVEVHLKSNLISMAARLTEKEEPEVADLLRGLHSVRVNVIGLDDSNRAEVQSRISSIRSDLDERGWERVVSTQEKNEEISVFVKTQGDQALEGVVVLVFSGKGEAVLVNVVGNIRPEKIALLGERMDLEPLKKIGKALKKDGKREAVSR